MKKRIIIAAIAVAAMAGCQKESDQSTSVSSDIVSFSSSGIATTRTTEILEGDAYVDAWKGNDRIGISSEGYTSNGFYEEYSNVEYAVEIEEPSVEVDFTVLSYDNAPLKPNSMSSDITYYAYYPYTSSVDSDGYIEVDISKQDTESEGTLGDADFMVASETITTPQDNVAFEFYHKLSKVIFKVSFNDEVTIRDQEAALEDLTAQICARAVAKYDREGNFISSETDDGSLFYMSSEVDTYNKQVIFTAILHPGSALAYQLYFYVGDQEYAVGDISGLTFSSGTIHTYTVTLGDDEVLFTGNSKIESWDSGSPTDNTLEAGSDEYLPQLFWDGSVATTFNGVAYDSGANGAEYEITDGSELALLSQLVLEGNTMYGTTFTVINDFTLSDREWTPIKYSSNNLTYSFAGTFDGGGYTISGLNIDYDDAHTGLFSAIRSYATVKNLTVKGSVASIYQNVGAIVGYNNGGTVENCYNEATVTNNAEKSNTGGVVGYNYGTVVNCSNVGDVTGYDEVGGVVGYNYKTVESCYNSGDVSGSYMYIGGVVGHNYDATLESCYNSGEVVSEGSYGYVGGIVGYNEKSEVENCYNIGDVSGYTNIGGIVGHNNGTSSVTAVYNTAIVTLTYNSGKRGGVAGYNGGSISYGFTYEHDVVGSDDGNTSYSNAFTNQASVTVDSETHSLIEWLKIGGGDTSWESDENSVNGGYPILTSINY